MLLVALSAPAAGARSPGADEYTLNIPGAGGSNHPGPGPAEGDPSQLPAATQQALGTSPDGAVLGAIATSRDLGAPDREGGGGGARQAAAGDPGIAPGSVAAEVADNAADRSIPAVLADAADDGSAMPLIAILVATAGAAGFVVVRRRTGLSAG